MAPRAIRFLCEVLPGASADVPLAYLQAFLGTQRRVRAHPLGAAAYGCDPRWLEVSSAFLAPPPHRFVNVVCVPFLRQITGPAPGDTAFAQALTAGAVNVAIVAGDVPVATVGVSPPWALVEPEARTLSGYDQVIVHQAGDAYWLAELIRAAGGDAGRVSHVPAQPGAIGQLLAAHGW